MTQSVRRNYPQLDTMRAVGSIAVVATHTSFWSGVIGNGLWGAATQRLEVGVAIFFVLSGFLLGRPYLQTLHSEGEHDSTVRYFWKRLLRIFPVYAVCVTGAFLLISENRELGFGRFVQNLLLVDLYFADRLPQGLTQMWSLTTELAFYLILPLLMAFVVRILCRHTWRPRRIIAFFVFLYAVNIVATASSTGTIANLEGWVGRSLISHIGWFALGLIIAVLTLDETEEAPLRTTTLITRIAHDRATSWTAAITLFVIAATPLAGSPFLVSITATEAVTRNLLYGAIAFLLIIPCVLGDPDTRTARLVAHPFLRHLGHISYSLFCCHVALIYLLAPRMGFDLFQGRPFALFFLILGISLVAAELLYRVVELPFLRLKSWRAEKAAEATMPSAKPTQS